MNLKSFQNEKGYFSKKLTESETTVIETRMKIQRPPRGGEKDQNPESPDIPGTPRAAQADTRAREQKDQAIPWGKGSQRQSQDPPPTTEASRAPTTGDWAGTADSASSGRLGGELTGSTKGAQQISSWDRPHAFILYLPSTFTFSDNC